MGYYLNPPEAKNHHDKIRALIDSHGARKVDRPPTSLSDSIDSETYVCVVDNGRWQACLLVHGQGEFDAVTDPTDYRPKTWLAMNKEKAYDMAGYKPE